MKRELKLSEKGNDVSESRRLRLQRKPKSRVKARERRKNQQRNQTRSIFSVTKVSEK